MSNIAPFNYSKFNQQPNQLNQQKAATTASPSAPLRNRSALEAALAIKLKEAPGLCSENSIQEIVESLFVDQPLPEIQVTPEYDTFKVTIAGITHGKGARNQDLMPELEIELPQQDEKEAEPVIINILHNLNHDYGLFTQNFARDFWR